MYTYNISNIFEYCSHQIKAAPKQQPFNFELTLTSWVPLDSNLKLRMKFNFVEFIESKQGLARTKLSGQSLIIIAISQVI